MAQVIGTARRGACCRSNCLTIATRHEGAKQITLTVEKDLGLVHELAHWAVVRDAVTVALIAVACRSGRPEILSAARLRRVAAQD